MAKTEELGVLFPGRPSLDSGERGFRVRTRCLADLDRPLEILYRDGRRCCSDEVLHPLRDIGLAVWLADGGGSCGRGGKLAFLNTTRLGADGAEAAERYFRCDLDLDCHTTVSGNRRRLIFTADGTEGLMSVVSHCLPQEILRRLPCDRD